MNIINNCFNTTISYTTSTLSLGVKAIAVYVAISAVSIVVNKSGLNVPITAISRKFEFAAIPIVDSYEVIQKIVEFVSPSIYYTSNLPFPGATLEECSPTRLSPLEYKCKLFNSASLAGVLEEFLMRGLLQRKILPWVAHQLPSTLANVLDHKITRIVLTSLIFAAGHRYYDDVSPQFVSGFIYGTVAEISQSLKIPILVHIMMNATILLIYANGNEKGPWRPA